MLERLKYGWSVRRVLYLLMGIVFTWFFIGEQQYFGAVAGVYFAAMGLFGFGCASGACATGIPTNRNTAGETLQTIEYEEIK